MHYYVKNLQGDIVRVVNEAGNTVASYEYDAWGKLLAAKNYYGVPVTDPNSIVLVNPLRYRGYVYDDETGLYYLQSRYLVKGAYYEPLHYNDSRLSDFHFLIYIQNHGDM